MITQPVFVAILGYKEGPTGLRQKHLVCRTTSESEAFLNSDPRADQHLTVVVEPTGTTTVRREVTA